METYNVIWFRHGLRIHDNPALLAAAASEGNPVVLLPIFIFDGESAGTKLVGYNRMKYLLEALEDLDKQFRQLGGQLHIFRGDPAQIFRELWETLGIHKICFEQDCEPIWRERDDKVKDFCVDAGIKCVEKISHTLWNPNDIIDTNGGIAPLTYQMFLHTVNILGEPSRPVSVPNWNNVKFIKLTNSLLQNSQIFDCIPKPEDFGVTNEHELSNPVQRWIGGETEALKLLQKRLRVEKNAFEKGYYMPNQATPDLLGTPTSMSPALRFGCLSTRKFYWDIHDLFQHVQEKNVIKSPVGPHITGQLIWREYFYTMSVQNPFYSEMENNPICLNIPWYETSNGQFEQWKAGKTGFPLIDASMRQLLAEGWIHHTMRNITATFLTRGALWISWEKGLQHFLKYLLDADWSVCAGNWMWVSSSAFEKLLDSSLVTCPIAFSKRIDPTGEYIRRYIPELSNYPEEYIHEPWNAPMDLQYQYKCIIGVHYPQRMIDFNVVSSKNRKTMSEIREKLLEEYTKQPDHCRPSSEDEIRQFFWLCSDCEDMEC